MKKMIIGLALAFAACMFVSTVSAGFDEFGYNDKARNFVGTGESWAIGKFGMTHEQAEAYLGVYAHDKIVMKWNAEWDRGNDENWANPPYGAYEDNEWNGRGPCTEWGGGKVEGSGEVWHYKIKWFDNSITHYAEGYVLPDGGYVIWGQFEVLMDQGSWADHSHEFLAKAIPCGYGP